MAWRGALLVLLLFVGVAAARGDDDGRHCFGDCRDGNPCTIDFCAGFGCTHRPVSGPACDDGDACTEGDACRAGHCQGRPRGCDDGLACTADSCAPDGGCLHEPRDANCGGGECGSGACRPDDPGADARGCVSKPVADGAPCIGDGVACTADLCADGECRHFPRDERCSSEPECRVMTCAPASDEADEEGCASASEVPSGEECSEDDEPCTDDLCRDGRCVHEEIADLMGCAPIRDPFRRARTLLALARTLGSALASAVDTSAAVIGQSVSPQSASPQSPLSDVEDDLDAAVRALAGKPDSGVGLSDAPEETTSQLRARIAATILRRTPGLVAGALRRMRRSVPATSVRATRKDGRVLLHGTRTLRRTLLRMTRVTRTLVQ